jgi:hypothetical protein
MKTQTFLSGFLVAALACLFTAGCNKKNEGEGTGKVSVSITDAPFKIDLIESAEITVSKVLIRIKSASDTVPYIVLTDKETTIDLIKLRNGVLEELVTLDIPSGTYNRINLIVSEASLKLKTGEVFDLKIPSGSSSGIKINITPPIVIESQMSGDVILDADLSKSFVLKGNPAKPDKIVGFKFKPVIRAVNVTRTGTVSGKVTDISLSVLENAAVFIKKDTVIATTFTDAGGQYQIPGVQPGTYTVYALKEKYDSLVFTGVKVVEGNVTVRNFALKAK